MGLVLITGPTEEPISLDEAKTFLRVDHAAENDLIDALIRQMRLRCEKVTWRALVTQTWKLTLENWPARNGFRLIELPKSPAQSVSGITYVHAATGVVTTLAADQYLLDATAEPATIEEAFGKLWPNVRCQAASIAVTFVCGYGLAAAVPDEVKEAIKAGVYYCYRHRDDRDEQYLDNLFAGLGYGQVA